MFAAYTSKPISVRKLRELRSLTASILPSLAPEPRAALLTAYRTEILSRVTHAVAPPIQNGSHDRTYSALARAAHKREENSRDALYCYVHDC